jgi:hypothetical protein
VNDFFNPLSKIGKLRRALLDLLHEHEAPGGLPTSERFLYYELEQRGVVTKKRGINPRTGRKDARPPIQDTIDALLDLREACHVHWDWIVDETRDVTEPAFAETVADYLRERIDVARIDLWDGEPPPLIVTESRATAGALRASAFDYLTPITATGGQAGGYLVTEVAPLIRGNERSVLYVGDWEVAAAGEFIEANTRRYLELHADRAFVDDPDPGLIGTWTRVALTGEQVAADRPLRGLVIETRDTRFKPARRYQAVECEALGQGVLVGLGSTPCSPPAGSIGRAFLNAKSEERRAIERILSEEE